ncbi:hypothetical protein [Sandaracinus amylolyticus]|uniref:Tryptophan synthase alpha chain n=1 Tax=Sandaracinus amylolyticus TaxID=927083 RepID=A0A0F6W3X6_9BACT|nr:hypothetical protein [Sandaracinus amylolyticus]AKF06773.1 Tryptophan synthase alpha chain [Sandaracinus amylolyticus]
MSRATRAMLAIVLAACGGEPSAAIDAGLDAPADAFVPADAAEPIDASHDAASEDEDAQVPSDGGSASPAERWVRAIARAQCGRWPRCGDLASWVAVYADCVPVLERFYGFYGAALERGAAEIDPAREAACIEHLATTCDRVELALAGPPCRDVIVGRAPIGAACGTTVECGRDAHCAHPENSCPGVCTVAADVGDACSLGELHACTRARDHMVECMPDATGTSGTCREIVVSVASVAGDRCGRMGNPESDVQIDRRCTDGLVCAVVGDTQRCVEPLEEGGACAPGRVCGAGLTCSASRCVRAMLVDEGEACDGVARVCPIDRGMRCQAGTCARVTDGAPGAPCGDPTSAECAPALVCDRRVGRCVAPRDAGAACERDIQCASRTCQAGTCAELRCR